MTNMLPARTASQVLAELLAISPQGAAMPTTPDTVFAQMLTPWANELSLVEALALAFGVEINPLTALYLLPDFERVLGPDPYGRDALALTIGERQQLAYSRWVDKFGVTPADFVALAATFGVVVSIQQYAVSSIGDAIGDFLTEAPSQFAWLVTLPTPAVAFTEVGSAEIGDYLDSFPPSLAQPAIAGRAPAQTTPYFSYTG